MFFWYPVILLNVTLTIVSFMSASLDDNHREVLFAQFVLILMLYAEKWARERYLGYLYYWHGWWYYYDTLRVLVYESALVIIVLTCNMCTDFDERLHGSIG